MGAGSIRQEPGDTLTCWECSDTVTTEVFIVSTTPILLDSFARLPEGWLLEISKDGGLERSFCGETCLIAWAKEQNRNWEEAQAAVKWKIERKERETKKIEELRKKLGEDWPLKIKLEDK